MVAQPVEGEQFYEAVSGRVVDRIALRDPLEGDYGIGHNDESTGGGWTLSNGVAYSPAKKDTDVRY
jgi:hypothetical protein